MTAAVLSLHVVYVAAGIHRHLQHIHNDNDLALMVRACVYRTCAHPCNPLRGSGDAPLS